jgi:EmrB/QacA subfamily drug resistance transporter
VNDSRQPAGEPAVIPCPERDKPWVLATAIFGSSLVFIEGSVVNLALPALQSDLDASSTGLQWVINAYLLMLGSFMLIGGSLGDRYGLRRIFLVGTAVFGAGALLSAAAPSLPILIGTRLLQGLGGALLVPTSLALVGSHFPEEERGRAIGTWAGASALTTAIGPVLGGWLVDQWSWPSVFLLVVPLALLTMAIGRWRVPVSPIRSRQPLDYPGALLLAVSLCVLIYALVSSAPTSVRLGLALLAAVSGALFVWRERRFPAPMLPMRLFRIRSFSGANLMTLLLYCALNGAFYFLPFNLIQVQGYSAMQAGAAFLPFTLILGFGSTYAGDLIRKADPRVILTAGPVIAAAGFAALAIPGANAPFVTGFLPGIVLMGIGMTLSIAPLTTVVMSSAGEDAAGVASGVNNTAARIAGVLAIAALTAVAVFHFTQALETRLHAAEVPSRAIGQLTANAAALAELEPPAGVAEGTAAAVARAVDGAYVESFRVLVLICAVLALLSSAVAWFSISGTGKRPVGDASQYDRS